MHVAMQEALGYPFGSAGFGAQAEWPWSQRRGRCLPATGPRAVSGPPAIGEVGLTVPRRSDKAQSDTAILHDAHGDGTVDTPSTGELCVPLLLLSEAELVERAKTEADAFAVLYERHVRSIYAFALSKVRDASNAEDVASLAFLKALRGLPRYQQRGVPFRSWLLRIASNVIVDQHRAPCTEVPLYHQQAGGEPDEEMQVADVRAEQEIVAWEQAEAFNRLIVDLTTEQRTVIQLRFVDGLPIAQIAARMSRSEGSVKMLLMRALQNLRRTVALEACDAG